MAKVKSDRDIVDVGMKAEEHYLGSKR